MKIYTLLLTICLFCASCTEKFQELDSVNLDQVTNDSILGAALTRASIREGDTIRFPPASIPINHGSSYAPYDIILDIPNKPNEYPIIGLPYVENSVSYTSCYIQYREKYSRDRNWYYYHPDTIQSKIPYKIDVPYSSPGYASTSLITLDSRRFPADEFEWRGQLFGQGYIGSNIRIVPATEWLPDNWSYMTWSRNSRGFVHEGSSDIALRYRERYDVPVQIRFNVTLKRRDSSVTQRTITFKVGDQNFSFDIEIESSTYKQTHVSNIIVKNVCLNSFNTIVINYFDGAYGHANYTARFFVPSAYRSEILHTSVDIYSE